MSQRPHQPAADQPLLALRVGDRDFALESGRTYLFGADASCDLQVTGPDVAPVHARLQMRQQEPILDAVGASVVLVNGVPGRATLLRVGDSVRLVTSVEAVEQGAVGVEIRVVRDLGAAEILPDPVLRAAAGHTAGHTAGPTAGPTAGHASGPRPTPTRRVVVPAATGERTSENFTDMMAVELRRMPWLGLSLLVHAALLLLLLWLFPAPDTGDRSATTYGFAGATGPGEIPDATPGPPDFSVESSDITEPELEMLQDLEVEEPDEMADLGEPLDGNQLDEAMLEGLLQLPKRSGREARGGGDVLDAGGGEDTGGFTKAVKELRRTGLDIVFVFDSTGSMSRSIQATKQNIAGMLETLRRLVPDARFGLVTYRDRGAEDYLTRELPLGDDFYAAVNFMQTVSADGGGDTPEAVRDGLQAAFQQPYRPGARRVVILAGDAPPQPRDFQKLLREVQQFGRGNMSSVHALVTNRRSGPDPDTQETFARIAQRGGGACVGVRDHEQILRLVLTLAFGAQYEGSLDAVRELIESDRNSPPTWALDLARRGGEDLGTALRETPLDDAVVNALMRRLRRGPACDLARLLAEKKLPDPSRNAIAYVLQQKLDLARAPIDPLAPAPLSRTDADRLCSMAQVRLRK